MFRIVFRVSSRSEAERQHLVVKRRGSTHHFKPHNHDGALPKVPVGLCVRTAGAVAGAIGSVKGALVVLNTTIRSGGILAALGTLATKLTAVGTAFAAAIAGWMLWETVQSIPPALDPATQEANRAAIGRGDYDMPAYLLGGAFGGPPISPYPEYARFDPEWKDKINAELDTLTSRLCLLYTSPSPRDRS